MESERSPLAAFRLRENKRQAEVAEALGVSSSALCKWERNRIPAERVLHVEKVTGIPRWVLRPDLYPPTDVRVTA